VEGDGREVVPATVGVRPGSRLHQPKPHLEGITELLDEMGRQGWEAVGVIGKSSSMAEHVTVLMKRPLMS
jgi:hypothetical protein